MFCIALAWALAFATMPVVLFWVMRGAYPGTLFWTAFWGYFALTYKLTAWLSNKYRERQRKTVVSAQDLLSRDARPYVLYLRSFKDDETTSRLSNLSTEEQELATVMLEIGPFVAFGEPGEKFPDPGAARMYVAEGSWQSEVENLMSRARLVVARVGNTNSFWWEMSRAVHLVRPERLLLLVPEDKDVYEEFRRKAKGVFPCQLPDHKFRPSRFASFKSHISLEGFLYFEPDWTPRLQRFKTPNLRQNYWAPGVPTFKTALRPVYERLGVEWERPPLQMIQILPLAMLLLFLMFAIYLMARLTAQLVALIQ
ncbi:MAG: hypothetical protein M3416_00400 [Acidobacteriota bacterium]|nr:hypothetical protein [Acidobacteriota bacterium]